MTCADVSFTVYICMTAMSIYLSVCLPVGLCFSRKRLPVYLCKARGILRNFFFRKFCARLPLILRTILANSSHAVFDA